MLNQHLEILFRIVLGTLLGALIGVERDLHGRPAGLRTHTIVALASATFMVVSTRFVYFQRYLAGDLVGVDPSRIAASVVSGIGFLGAGAILRTGITVRGLTTAAGLWLVAAIGMAAGGGMYVEAAFTTLVGLAALTLMRRFEDRGGPTVRRRVTAVIDETVCTIPSIVERLARAGAILSQERYERPVDGECARVTFEARTPLAVETFDLGRSIQDLAGVRQILVEPL